MTRHCADAVAALRCAHGGWLVCDGQVLASLRLAATPTMRRRGFGGVTEIHDALLFPRTRSVHTFTMTIPIDVAVCDRELRVVKVLTVNPNRLVLPCRHGVHIIEAAAGLFTNGALATGDQLEIRA